jgi:hypothetical protein
MDKKKQKKRKWKTYVYVLILIFPCFELALRILGAEPYIQQDYVIKSIPAHPFFGDSLLGISLNTGDYEIEINNRIKFRATHDSSGHRKTYRNDSIAVAKNIVSLGCSFTYGYGVNDTETFTYLLQKNNPKFNFTNMGIIGYGTVQSYLQLKRIINSGDVPDVVLLNFSSYHLERNPMVAFYRRALKIGFNNSLSTAKEIMKNSRFPFSNSTKGIDIEYVGWQNLYSDWKGREYSATINYIQTAWDKLETSNLDLNSISTAIIKEMNKLCTDNGIDFYAVMLDEVLSISLNLKSNGVQLIEVGLDFSDTTVTNLPFDMHPNNKGHEQIFEAINNKLSLKESAI